MSHEFKESMVVNYEPITHPDILVWLDEEIYIYDYQLNDGYIQAYGTDYRIYSYEDDPIHYDALWHGTFFPILKVNAWSRFKLQLQLIWQYLNA